MSDPVGNDSVNDQNDLIKRADAGDEKAVAELFANHRDRLWRMVHFRLDHRLRGRIDADDVLQEAWLAAQQRFDHFKARPEMSAFVWLRLIVGQTLIDVHRRHLGAERRSVEKEQSIQQKLSQGTSMSLSFHLLAHLTSPSHAAERAEMTELVQEALNGLSPIDCEVLALRHFEELTNNEVAEILGLDRRAASNRYVRALTRLRSVLAHVPGFFDDAEES